MTVLPSPVPSPLEFCPFDMPAWAFEALEWVVGFDWPAGNELSTWDVADRWYGLAVSLAEPHDAAFGAASTILSGYGGSGITADGFRQAWQGLSDGDEAPLNALLQVAHELGELVEGCGRDLEAAKLEAWIEIGIFLIELIGMAVTVALTLGAASPAAGGLIMATRIVVQRIFKRLIEDLGKKALKKTAQRAVKQITTKKGLHQLGRGALHEGIDEAKEEFAINAGIQLYQQGNGRAHGIDLTDLGMSAAGGFAGGAAANGAHVGSHGHHGGAARGAGGEVLAEFGAAAIYGDIPDVESVAKSGVSGAAGSGLHGVAADFQSPFLSTPLISPVLEPSAVSGIPFTAAPAAPSSAVATPGSPFPAAVDAPDSSSPATVDAPDSPSPATVDGPDSPSPAAVDAPGSGASPFFTAASDTAASPASPAASTGSPSALLSSSSVPSLADSVSSPPPDSSASSSPAFASSAAPPGTTSPLDSLSSAASPVISSPLDSLSTAASPVISSPLDSLSTAAPSPDSSFPSSSPAGPSSSSPAGPSSPGLSDSSFSGSSLSGSSFSGSPHSTGITGPTISAISSPLVSPSDPTFRLDSSPGITGAPIDPASNRPDTALGFPGPNRRPTPAHAAQDTARHVPRSDLDRIADALSPRPTRPASPRHLRSSRPDPLLSTDRAPLPSDLSSAPISPDRSPSPGTLRNETGYFGYAHHARTTHELNRREEYAAYLTTIADESRAKILSLGRQADAAFRAGATLRGEEHRRRAIDLSEIVAEIETEVDQVRRGAIAPAKVDVDPHAWNRINADVGDLAPGGVLTDDRSALTGAGGRPPIDHTRHYNTYGGLRPPLAVHQTDLETAMPQDGDGRTMRLADPRVGRWFHLANDGGPEADPTRGLNCVDGVLALFDTYVHGRPRVSAPRTFDAYAHGNPNRPLGGEQNGVRRILEATGGTFQNLCPYLREAPPVVAKPAMDQALRNLTNHLHNSGHGAFAFIITDMEAGGSHAWSAVNHKGTILFLDPQVGHVTEDVPLYRHHGTPTAANIISMDALVVTANGDPVPLPHHGPGQWSPTPTGTDDPARPARNSEDRQRLESTSSAPRTSPPDHLLQRPDTVLSDASDLEWRLFESLPGSEQEVIRESVRASFAASSRIAAELNDLVVELGTFADQHLEIVGDKHSVKSAASIARDYAKFNELGDADLDSYLGAVKDRVRFSIQTPEAGYGAAVTATLDGLVGRGYRIGKRLSFWGERARHNGLNVTVTDPAGVVMEIQFPTRLSYSLGRDTHRHYEVVRASQLSGAVRVEAFLEILKTNKAAGMANHQPHGLDQIDGLVWKDSSFTAWLVKDPSVWRRYLGLIARSGKSLDESLGEYGLTREDLFGRDGSDPVSDG